MKSISLYLFICLALLPASAQDIPEWFFNHDDDEFVGVSLPMKDADPHARHAMALSAAMASYCAMVYQDSLAIKSTWAKDITQVETYGKRTDFNHLEEVHWKQQINYTITRRYNNDIGEEYIAARITEGTCAKVDIYYEEHKISRTDEHLSREDCNHFHIIQWNQIYICKFYSPDEKFEITCSHKKDSTEYTARSISIYGISQEKPYLHTAESINDPERICTVQCFIYPRCGNGSESVRWIHSHDCSESLFNAYMTCILRNPYTFHPKRIAKNHLFMDEPEFFKNLNKRFKRALT